MESTEATPAAADSIDNSDGELVPGWLRRLAAIGWRVLVTIALGAVLTLLAIQLATVTLAVILGAIIAATLAPYVHGLEVRRNWSSTKATIAVCLVAVGIVVAALALLLLAFIPYVNDIINFVQQGSEAAREWLASLGLSDELVNLIKQGLDFVRGLLLSAASELVAPIANLVTVLLLASFLVFFYLQGGEKAWVSASKRMTPWREEILFVSLREGLARVGGYLRGTAILAAGHALTDFVYMTLLGVPLAGPIAVLVFALTFIPYVGGVVGLLIVVLVAFATVGSTKAILLLLLIAITNVVLNSILRPIVYGRTVKIHPALVLIALPTGAAFFGMAGLFVALPVLAFAMAVIPGLLKVLSTGPGPSTDKTLVPLWLERLGAWSWRGLVIILTFAVALRVIVAVPVVVVPLVLSFVFAATLAPLAAYLRRRGIGRTAAALISVFGMVVVILVITAAALLSILDSLGPIFDNAADGAAKTNIQTLVGIVGVFREGLFSTIGDIVSAITSTAVGLFLAGFLTFYLLRDGERLGKSMLKEIDSPIRRDHLEAAGTRAVNVLSGYMVATGLVSAVGAGSQWLIMFLLGLPLAAPLAILSFFGGFIPYIGSLLTTGLALLVTISTGSPTDIVVMIIFTLVFNIVQGNIVGPIVYSRAVHIHPAVVLMAVPAGAAVAGIIGMFLAVPFLGIVSATWSVVLHAFDPDDTLTPDPIAPEVAETTAQPGAGGPPSPDSGTLEAPAPA